MKHQVADGDLGFVGIHVLGFFFRVWGLGFQDSCAEDLQVRISGRELTAL